MKKICRIALLLFVTLVIVSCNEDFNPFKESEPKFILTSILRSDTTYQTAYLSKSYFTNSSNLYANDIDPSIIGADIRVWYKDSVYVFRDTSVDRTDSLYKTDFNFYYSDIFKVSKKEPIEIEVLLSNGKRLKSKSITPDEINFTESEVLIPPVSKDFIQINWENTTLVTFYTYKLVINYTENENGNVQKLTKEIPLNYIIENGLQKPIYPKPTIRTYAIYQLSTITEAMKEISNGSDLKSNYSINENLIFELIAYDENVSKYISSTSGAFDGLTVRVNELDFTNINGGLGIFGSFINENYNSLRFQRNFVESFGYHFIQN